jgi:hypothetical protein
MRSLHRTVALVLLLGPAVTVPAQQEQGSRQPPAGGQPSQAPEGQQRHVISAGPGGKTLEISAGPGSILGKDELILKQYVDIKFGDSRLQADYVRYTVSTKEAYAEGNVVLDQGPSRITADAVVYNLETETGTFFQSRGYAEPNLYFEAKRMEKISHDELVLHDAKFTACTQPIPYWSFKVGHGLIRLDDYAYLHDLSFKVGRATVFYTPYLVWPVKSERAAGLLFPEFGFSRRGGTVISNAFYWPIRRNMDATFFLDYLSLAGIGNGLEYRYVPSETGAGLLTGYYIHDDVQARVRKPGIPVDRWVLNYAHHQDFDSGWRLIANANFISDFDYYLDFVRDLRQSTNPQAVTNIFLTRNWGFYSVNVRGERREQLLSAPVQPTAYGEPFFATEEETINRWILPEVELRGRRQRLGSSPFYLTLQSSVDSFRKSDVGVDYQRLDLFPQLSSQLSPVPWLDVSASVAYRDTYYTNSQGGDLGCDNQPNTGDYGEGNGVVDGERDIDGDGLFTAADDLGCDNLPNTGDYGEGNGVQDQERTVISDRAFNRRLYQSGVTIIGPKISRVFDTPTSTFSPQFKNTIEPTFRYAYTSEVQRAGEVIPFDEIDTLGGRSNMLTYGVVTRLFAKRPAGGLQEFAGPAPAGGGFDPFGPLREAVKRDQAAREQASGGGAAPPAPDAGQPAHKELSTVEIATLEISQDYSFLGPLSTSFALGEERHVSPVHATLRYNPSLHASVDLRTSYNVLFNEFSDVSLSANLRNPKRGFLDLTWTLQRDLEGQAELSRNLSLVPPFSPSQIGLQGETNLRGGRILLGMQANYELGDVQFGEPRLRDQRYKFGYNTQCCGIQFEILNRNFVGTSQNEIRFLINLKGVGNVIDLQSQIGGLAP